MTLYNVVISGDTLCLWFYGLDRGISEQLDADVAFGILLDVYYQRVDVSRYGIEPVVELSIGCELAERGLGIVELFGELRQVGCDFFYVAHGGLQRKFTQLT